MLEHVLLDVGQLQEGAGLVPQSLHDHGAQLHGVLDSVKAGQLA